MAGLNNSIFELPSSLEQVRKPEEVIKVYTRKVIPKSGSKKADFPGSEITFDFSLSANQWWLPSRSYVVIQDSIYIGAGGAGARQPLLAEDVAPAFNLQDNLFDGCEMTVGGFSLGSKTKLAPQISAVNRRLAKSAGFNKGVAKSAHTFEADYNTRKQNIVSDGILTDPAAGQTLTNGTGTVTVTVDTAQIAGAGTAFTTELSVGDTIIITGANVDAYVVQSITSDTVLDLGIAVGVRAAAALSTFTIRKNAGTAANRTHKNERVYVPPLGIFSQGKALPPARYELILRPKPDVVYKQSALESLAAALVVAGGARDTGTLLTDGEYEYLVEDIVFYVAVVENFDRVPDKQTYLLDLEETEVLPRSIKGNGANIVENYTVSKSTFALSVALQDRRAGNNTLFAPSLFKTEGASQSAIKALRIDYAGQTRPNPSKALLYDAPNGDDRQTWGYLETAVENLGYYDTGGVLTKEEWRKLGELFHYQWRKTGDDISTDVNVDVTYGTWNPDANHNLLLFHHFRRVIEFTIVNNQVTDFLAQDA